MLDYFADFVLRHCMLVQRARRGGPREGRGRRLGGPTSDPGTVMNQMSQHESVAPK